MNNELNMKIENIHLHLVISINQILQKNIQLRSVCVVEIKGTATENSLCDLSTVSYVLNTKSASTVEKARENTSQNDID